MKKLNLIAFFSIVLISLLVIGAVGAADVVGSDDGTSDDGILTIDGSDEAISSDGNSGGNVEKTFKDLENDALASTDVKSEDDYNETSDILKSYNTNAYAGDNSDEILGNDAQPGTFTDLKAQIDDAGESGILVLPYDFTYDSEYDGDSFPDGIVIASGLTINGNEKTISGADLNRIFKVAEGVTLTLNNLTICHGAASDGAGVYVNSGATLNANHVTFTENKAAYHGGAIYSEGTVTINNSVLDKNDITDRSVNGYGGAAIYMKNAYLTLIGSNVTNNVKDIVVRNNGGDLISAAVTLLDSSATIKGSLFKNNSACYGGAIDSNGDTHAVNLKVDSCTFTDNFAYNGAGIDMESTVFNVTNSTFKGNEVKGTGSSGTFNSCGGAIAMGGSETTGVVNNCTFEENFAEYTGGAIVIASGIPDNAQILINDSVFIRNQVLSTTSRSKNLGGAIRDEHYGTIVANSTFKENHANYEGGAIYYNNQFSITDRCVFEDNSAYYMGGAIFYFNYNNKINNSEFYRNNVTNGNGGAIAFSQTTRTLTIDNSKFAENEANSGGAIYNGAISITNSSFTSNIARTGTAGAINLGGHSGITDCNFTSNTAKTNGGALWLGGSAHTNVINSRFDNNIANTTGGAIWANANVGMVYSNFTSNKAVANGGAIYTQKVLSIDNGVFNENSAKLGGAIYDNGNLILTDSTLTGNNATQGAGVYIVKAKEATISISEFTDNNCNENSHSIYNDGTLALSRNTISNAIYNNLGTITTQTYTVVLNNETKVVSDAPVTIDVVILDDNNNKITGFDAFNMTVLIDSVGYKANATLSDEYVYETAFTPETLGKYLVSANYSGSAGLTKNVLKTGEIYYIKGTYTDLQAQIDAAGETLVLPYDFAYTESIDGDRFPDGVIISKTISIDGNGFTICGNDSYRIFDVIAGTLTLNNVTVCHGNASQGAGVYVCSGASLVADGVTFTDNTANTKGGAIYSEGDVTVKNSEIDSNDIATRKGPASADNGGAAIYNSKGTLYVENTNITNNLKNITIRNGNAGDLIDGAIVTSGETIIIDSYIANNTGSYGGAITSTGYANDQPYTLTVTGTTFEGNNATFGGAIFVESGVLVVDDCDFIENAGVGVGSSGTSNTQGGAIVVFPNDAKATITNSRFNKNGANLGGAVSLAGVDQDSLIDNCTFTDNTASSEGGAVYLWTQGDASVMIEDSEFSGNTAPWGNAISNDGILELSNNTVSTTSADIANYYGVITSEINAIILNNETVPFNGEILVTAKVTDDNDNLIRDINFEFVINETVLPAVFNTTSNLYQATYTNDVAGIYVANITYIDDENLKVKTATLRNIKGTYTDLAGKITDAILYHDGVLNLTYDFAYTPEIDEVYIEGILIQGTSLLTVNGNNHTISGSKLAGIFNIQLENATTFNNITFANAYAGAVLTTSKLIINNCAFINNTDYYDGGYDEGGAISSTGGELVITDSVFINNTARDGGAIDVEGANVTLTNCVFTDNKAVGDGIDSGTGGAISAGNTEQTLTVNNCVFTNNIASTSAVSPEYAPKGGAISSSGHVIITNSNFTNNSADYGGAIEFAFASAEISNSNFTDNTAVYRGGAIYSESTLNVDHCVFDKNDITFRTRNDDNGGAAIYNLNGTLTINNTNITNSVKDIVIRNGNAGDLLVGVVVTSGDTLINNSYFANNTGSWGGAISSLGYMNNNPYTLTVENTKFEGNNATFGGAIFVESSELVVDNCTFENNKGVGVGSSGTSNTQGGAIVVFPSGAKASITNSTFIANSANTGGAVSFAGVDQDSLIDNCTFTDNTASDGGAVYLWTGGDAVVTVKDSDFSGNTAEWGNAISNDGKLALSNNTISSTSADIGDYYGVIVSEINVVVLNNMTVDFIDEVLITAKVTDDNNNLIKDINFDFDINGTIVHAVFNSTSGLYQGTYTNDVLGVYVANMTYPIEENLIVKTATLRNIKGTFTDLAGKILDAILYHDGVLNLTYDFAYVEYIDLPYNYGIVIGGDSLFTINGNNHTISGSNLSGIFNIQVENALTFNNITFANAYAGAILNLDSKLIINNCTFINNTNYYDGAYDEGGAISSTGGELVIADSVFINNTAADGGAIEIEGANVTLTNCVFTNNTAAGDGVDSGTGGAIRAGNDDETLIVNNCVFTNNIASTSGSSPEYAPHGGAILSSGHVIITNSNFTNNSADEGGAIMFASASAEISNSNFADNTASECAADIYNRQSITNIRDCTFDANNADEVSAIYNDDGSELSLSNNNISSTKAEIVSDGIINSTINIIALGNTTVPARIGEKVTITAKVTDDNGNLIKDSNFTLVVDGVEIDTAYNDTSNLYQAIYTAETAGSKIVNMTYLTTDNLVTYIGILDVPKNNATLILTVGECKVFAFGDNITVFISLYDNETLAGLNEVITVIINDTGVPVEVINGTASFNVTGFEPGQYAITGLFNGTVNYNGPLYSSDVFTVLNPNRILSIEVEDTVLGEPALITITVTDHDGNPGEGMVILNISGSEISLKVNGTATVEFLPPATGIYLVNATLIETDLDAAVVNDTETFIVSDNPLVIIDATANITITYGENDTVIITPAYTLDLEKIIEGNATIKVYSIEELTAEIIQNINKLNATLADIVNYIENFDATAEPDMVITGISVGKDGAVVNIPGLNAGAYIMVVNFTSSNYYFGEAITGTVVLPAKADVNITATSVVYGEHVTVTVIATGVNGELLNGTVGYYIDGVDEVIGLISVENGTGSLGITYLLDADEYAIYSVFVEEHGNYIDVNSISRFTVYQAVPTLSVVADDVLYTETPVINIVLNGVDGLGIAGETLIIDVSGMTYVGVTDENGTVQVIIDKVLPIDTYNITVEFGGNNNYLAYVNDTESFKVSNNNNLTFTIGATSVAYPEMVVFAVVSEVDGTATVYVANNDGYSFDFTIEVKNHFGIFALPGLVPAEYQVNATYEAYGYNATEGETEFTVVKGATEIEAMDCEVVYGDDAVIVVIGLNEDATGNVTVVLDGNNYTAPVDEGIAVVEIPGLGVGEYLDLAVTYTGDSNYKGSSTEASIIVTPAPSSVVIDDIADVVYSASVEVTYTVVNETTVTVVVKDADGTEITTGVNTTTAGKVIISGLDAGKYTISVSNAGEGNYSASSDEKVFNVLKATITIEPNATGDFVVDGQVNVTFTVPTDITGMLDVTIDGEPVLAFEVINGTCTIPGTYAAGPHTVIVMLTGDSNYENAVGQTTFDIAKVVMEMNATIEAGTAVEDVNVTVTLPEDATGHVLVYVDDMFITSVPVNNGIANFPIYGFDAGEHNLTVTYDGDDKYTNGTFKATFETEKAPTNTTINATVDGFDVEITVYVNSTVVVNGGNLTLTFNGENTTADVVNGVAVFKFSDLPGKTYNITAVYSGNGQFLSSNATGSAKVVRVAAYLKPLYEPFIFNYGHLYRFRLFDKAGNPLAGKTVEFSVHSKVYYVTTGKDGWGQIQLTPEMLIKADKIFSRLIFRGDGQYKPATYAVWFNAMKEQAKFTNVKALKASYKVSESNKQVTATLKDSKGNPIAGKQVSISVNGKAITAKTNSKGVVTFKLDSFKLNVGQTAFILIFEDVNYKRTTFQSVISIVKD